MMRYSFEILSSRARLFSFGPKRVRLHCKVDCSVEEMEFVHSSGLYDVPIYEFDRNRQAGPRLVKAMIKFAASSPNAQKNAKIQKSLAAQYVEVLVFRQFLTGVTLEITPGDIPRIEHIIEARLKDTGQAIYEALRRLRDPGRSHHV